MARRLLMSKGVSKNNHVRPDGMIEVDKDTNTIFIHDGSTPGGVALQSGGSYSGFNQDLNTTDNVTFNSIAGTFAGKIDTSISANLRGDVALGTTNGDDVTIYGTAAFNSNTVFGSNIAITEQYSSTPTNKYFEIESSSVTRILRAGVNASAFGTGVSPSIELTAYRSSPANNDVGPEIVFRTSSVSSLNQPVATIQSFISDIGNGTETGGLTINTYSQGSQISPLVIDGADVVVGGKLLASASDGSTNIGTDVERFGTAYVWGTNYKPTTSVGGDGGPNYTALVPYIEDPDTGNIVQSSLFVLNSTDVDDRHWLLPDGVEGQVVQFVPGTNAGVNQHLVKIGNWRRWVADAGVAGEWTVSQNLDWFVFAVDPFNATERYRGVATAVFVNGAWQTDSPWID